MANDKKSIKEIKELLQAEIVDAQILMQLKKDARIGVKKEIERYEKRLEQIILQKKKYEEMLQYEKEFIKQGYKLIAGIDEVGRGPLAGPVVASAVILKEDSYIPGLDDSKKLSEAKRDYLYEKIIKEAVAIGVGVVGPSVIDEVNIYEATKIAMLDAIGKLAVKPEALLLDAMKLSIDLPQESLIKGDQKSVSIAAASIIAKVTRDNMMKEYANTFPQYGFEKHMGYGTKQHLIAIEEYGVLNLHRKSFEPIKSIVKEDE